MISLQPSTQQIHDVISWNDATITGILIAVSLAFGSVIFYLYKAGKDKDARNEERLEKIHKEYALQIANLYKEYIGEVKSFNDMLLKINNQYTDSLRNLNDSIRNLVDFKKQ